MGNLCKKSDKEEENKKTDNDEQPQQQDGLYGHQKVSSVSKLENMNARFTIHKDNTPYNNNEPTQATSK